MINNLQIKDKFQFTKSRLSYSPNTFLRHPLNKGQENNRSQMCPLFGGYTVIVQLATRKLLLCDVFKIIVQKYN